MLDGERRAERRKIGGHGLFWLGPARFKAACKLTAELRERDDNDVDDVELKVPPAVWTEQDAHHTQATVDNNDRSSRHTDVSAVSAENDRAVLKS